jgi:hypothetical protein
MASVRRKVFISYHHDDQIEVGNFVKTFGSGHNIFITRGLGIQMPNDVINSNDTDYVMSRIRELYLSDSSVTLVLIGKCTWARRYVDWEIQSSLRRRQDGPPPNGLLGIVLPSAGQSPRAPERLRINLNGSYKDGYARWYWYPSNGIELANWIEDAFSARTKRAELIDNPRERFINSKFCS